MLAVLSGVIVFTACIPYIIDIIRGRVLPARSTRIMMVLLLGVALLQQHSLGSKWALLLLVGEFTQAVLVFIVSLKYGVGGFTRIDIVCYVLLFADILIWSVTNNSLLGIHITITADLIASAPMLIKTWKNPKSETPLFFWLGALAAFLAIASESVFTYGRLAFPIYLVIVNVIVALLTYRTSPERVPATP